MANFSQSDSRRLYSWWWDSHIGPKNSKWLQENITDMDRNVKTMIKLIEEDADSFAKRAEMYYKKRPELMRLVEDFYRAYRSLAERYDHATGALRQAHRTIGEAFPNQDPFVLAEDSQSGTCGSEVEPRTPEPPHPVRAMFDPDDLHKDALGHSSSHFHAIKRNGAHSNESDSAISNKGLKQLNELFGSEEGAPHYVKFAEKRITMGLDHHVGDGNDSNHEMRTGHGNQSSHMMNGELKTPIKSSSERAFGVETEIQTLKDSLAKFEAEKQAGLIQYQHALERLSKLEDDVSRAQEDAKGLNERACKAESEVQTFKEALMKLQAEKEAGLLKYQQCVERMSILEDRISHVQEDTERAIKAETESQSLKQALARVEVEKEASLLQYNQCLEKMSNLEAKVLLAEENARNLSERAVRAETEFQFLKETIAKLDEEKEAASLQYQRSLEMISTLQGEVSHAQEVARRLSSVIVMGVAKLNSTEEQYLQLERENQSLQEEVDTLVEMMTLQKQEFSEKYEELEKLQLCIDEECSRSMEAEAALHTLQNLHSEWQEEREALALEVQNGVQRLKDKELEYNALEEETCFAKEENKILNEQNISMSITEKNLQLEIVRLKEAQVKLDKEIEVLVNQRDALQQELCCLKEELDDLKKRHLNVYEQMEQVGLNPDTLISSVKSFQDENSRLKEIHHKDNNEKESLMEKLKNMENLFEKNALLENSLLDVNAGFALLREKVKTLEETCQSLELVNSAVVDEKESLLSQLMVSNRNVEKLSEKETFLVEFLFDANIERAWLREKSKSLEEFCESLDNEKHGIFIANNNLISEFKSMQQKLDDLGMKHTTLEESHSCLEKEMEFKIHQLEELQATLSFERKERATFEDNAGTQLAHLEHSNRILQEEGNQRMKEFEDEQFKVVKMCLEVFILQKFIRDMEERNISLFIEYQKLLEASRLSDNLVMSLGRENFEQQVKVSSLLEQLEKLRSGIRQMAFSLKIEPESSCQAKIEEEQLLLEQAMKKIEDLETSLWLAEDEKHQMLLEKSVFLTLLGQLKLETASIEVEKTSLDRHLKLRTEDLLQVQAERNELRSANDHLNHQIGFGKDILSEKESELLEAEQKVKAMECENMELKRKLNDVNSESDEARLTRDVLEKQILSISESITHKNKEIECFQKVTGNLELDLSQLHEEIKQQSVEKDKLSSELQHKRNEIKLWEYEAETLYSDCQVTNICAIVFEDKVHELGKANESLEDDSDSKEEDIERLKERLNLLELENQEAKSELAAYLPVLASLRNSVTSLEGCVIPQSKNIRADNRDTEVADLPNQHDKNKELPETQSFAVGNGVSDLLELQARIEKIESSVVEQKRLIMQSVVKNIQLLHNSKSNSSEVGNEVLVKDIPLDQVSQCSSYDHGFVPNGMSKREDSERIEEVHEPWGIVEQDCDHDLPFDQGKKLSAVPGWEKHDFFEIEQVEKKSEYPSSEIQSEEMSVMSLPQEGNKRKILERLASDAQKLTNLQLTVQDLNKKVEQLERHKKPKDAEFITAKKQLKEVEEAIMQLVDSNQNLSKKAEGHTSGVPADGKLTLDTEKAGKERKSRISERARRASEKIGRLQLEVQGIQFVLLKVEDRYRAKLGDRKVLLMDYLYGQSRSSTTSKRKKRPFFSCVKPPSRSD